MTMLRSGVDEAAVVEVAPKVGSCCSARENLEQQDKRLLNELMEEDLPLYHGYSLKEQLRALRAATQPWARIDL